jgi:hypothetical protein
MSRSFKTTGVGADELADLSKCKRKFSSGYIIYWKGESAHLSSKERANIHQ